ncbi:hypothetical protein K439DRAFT_1400808 [Ramaria rubella]|nr:hypothetical protein K439DRAFT_1400808 [Ramaria rubella]
MALQPSLHFLRIAGPPSAPHTLEIFIDYVCPFSAKIVKSVEHNVKPLLSAGGKYEGKVKLIIRLHPQPWHGTSPFTHEAAIAVGRIKPDAFWPYTLALMEKQTEFYDEPTSTLTPLQIREKLVELASHHIAKSDVEPLKELLKIKGTPNGGVATTEDLKYNIKYSRANSIHVSPTVLWNGLIAGDVSSSFQEPEWRSFFEQKIPPFHRPT